MGCFNSKSRTNPQYIHKAEGVVQKFQKTTKTLTKSEALIDKYSLEQTLAILPYGTIVKAIHKPSKLLRSIKILNLKINDSIELNEKQLKVEVNALSQLDHPSILKIYDILQDNLKLYIIMEYWEGGLLLDKLKEEGTISEKKTGVIIEQILSAINYCHQHCVIHRDINPKLIFMMNKEGKPYIKIGEFGSSAFIDSEHKLEGKFDTSVYVAPEVANDDYNERCDLWSVGILLYVLLTGRTPYSECLNDFCLEEDKKKPIDVSVLKALDVTDDAIDLILKLLTYDYRLRITANEALNHRWFSAIKGNEERTNKNLVTTLQNLSCYNSTSKLIDSIQGFITRQVITHKENKDLIAVFKELDSNWDGKLSKEELLKYYNKTMPKDDALNVVNDIFSEADTDKSGFIEYSEFIKSAISRSNMISKNHLKTAFQMIDCDENGKLSRKELQSIIDGTSLSGDRKWMKLLTLADKNNDGEIDLKEFYDLLLAF